VPPMSWRRGPGEEKRWTRPPWRWTRTRSLGWTRSWIRPWPPEPLPGAALAIGRHGRLVRLRGYGVLDPADTVPVSPTTLFDLASLTKVVGTTSAIMLLVDEGAVELDAPVVDYLPWWAGPHPAKAGITVRQLLSHRAGLAPFRRWYLEMEGEEAYRAALAAEAPATAPGGPPVYSDLGVMTLGFLVEAVAGEPLDAFLDRRVFRPLAMEDTGFRPDPALVPRIAPTEVDTVYRHRHLRGEVHDENAWALGGVAGHAGLFSSAAELAVFAQLLLDRGVAVPCRAAEAGATCPEDRGDEVALLDSATVRLFTTPVSGGTTRALGWDTPGGRSSAGDYFTPSAFGHTGYTGTSIWIDPELDLFVVLLTNRVNPTRANTQARAAAPAGPRPGCPGHHRPTGPAPPRVPRCRRPGPGSAPVTGVTATADQDPGVRP
jgi:CubicO group peptidase (beta-lactamase class C family)